MSESRVCPECGTGMPADAPAGLCPRCLLGAAVVESRATFTDGSREAIEDQGTEFGSSPVDRAMIVPVALDQFTRAVLELGLIPAGELERFGSGVLGGVPGLVRALVVAGKLTPYQAAAVAQGKARGLVIGNYFILDKLGAGGMGVVFKARHRRLGRIVALKILPPSLARGKELLLRFRREVDVAARLSHPNIVAVLDAAEDRGVQFMTMEYIQGKDLERLVRDGGVLPVDQALDCVIQAARGLAAAHGQGIVHRDIKPGNLMLDASGVVRVLDLGLARLVEAANPFGTTTPGPLTRSGTYMGTVDFMAPEQGVDSRRVDHRADIYSLGCTLCYLLTGRAPFDGATVLARLLAHQERLPTSLLTARPDVPRAIDAVYQKMMAKQPADRPASMTEVVMRLETCRAPSIETEEARSGLKTLAQSVIVQRAASQGTLRDSPILERDEPFELSLGPDPKRDIVLFDDWEPNRPAAPGPAMAGAGPPLLPERTASTRPRRLRQFAMAASAMGALALLGVAGLGISLMTHSGPGPTDRRVEGPVSPRTTGSQGLAGGASTRPAASPPSGTFDVATFYEELAGAFRAIGVSADGHRALVGGMTQYPEVLNVDEAKFHHSLNWHFSSITDVAMTPDGRRGLVATGNVGKRANLKAGGTLWFWDLKTFKPLFPMQQPYPGAVTSVAISADGRRGLSAGGNGELTLWDLTTGQSLRPLGPQDGAVSPHAMAFFPDGRSAATAGRDKRVHIWDIDTGQEQAAWTGHDGSISGLAISADGHRVLTGSDDATVILWAAGGGTILHRFPMPPNDKNARVAFDSEGHIVAAGNGLPGPPSQPGNLLVWDANTYVLLRRDEASFTRHLALAVLPGGRVLTGDEYGIRIWTPRRQGVVASAPPAFANRSKDPVNLIALVAHEPHKSWGKWQSHQGALLSPTTRYARLRVPYTPPPDYRIDMKVELVGKESDRPFDVGLVVGGRQTEIVIDRVHDPQGRRERRLVPNGRYTGLSDDEGVPVPFGPGVHHGRLLFSSRPVRLSVTVRPTSVQMTCDGATVVDWHGDPKRLLPHIHWNWIGSNSLFLSSSTSVLIHEMSLIPLADVRP